MVENEITLIIGVEGMEQQELHDGLVPADCHQPGSKGNKDCGIVSGSFYPEMIKWFPKKFLSRGSSAHYQHLLPWESPLRQDEGVSSSFGGGLRISAFQI